MDVSRNVWRRIDSGRGVRNHALRRVGIPSAVWALNRAGMGPFEARLTGKRLRESGLEAMADLVAALQIHAREVIFGHTHRPGPLPQDDDWSPRLFNTGSWLYEPNLLNTSAGESPYWPGTVMFVADGERPRLERLLARASHDDLGARDAYS